MNRSLLTTLCISILASACTRDVVHTVASRDGGTAGAVVTAAENPGVDEDALDESALTTPVAHEAEPAHVAASTKRVVEADANVEPLLESAAQAARPCNVELTEQALCACLSLSSFESELGSCEVETLGTDELATMRTPGGDVYAVAQHGKGFYALGRLHVAGMEDFAVRAARVENAGSTRVLRIVTWMQVGSSDWMHTANQVVICPLTGPRDAQGGCFAFPLYAHTREMVNDVANEQESKFRVAITTDGSAIVRTRGALQHPELRAELGEQRLRARR
jgi:hypothetical protein